MKQPTVLEHCTRENGTIDWNQVAKLSRYALSVEQLEPVPTEPLTTVVEQGIIDDKLPETVAVNPSRST